MNKNVHSNNNDRVTHFQRRVYEAVKKIPRGRVTTYKIIALHLSATGRPARRAIRHRRIIGGSAAGGKCASCRAVGQALRRNPFAPKVPCHRVIASDLSSGGFNGCRKGKNIKRKLQLLAEEGIQFKDGRLANPARIYQLK